MSTRNQLNAYHETKIKTASQGKLVIMLYDETVKQLDLAIENLEKGPKYFDRVNKALLKAQDLITELMVSLDFEKGGDIASNLFSLYMFFNKQILDANMKKKLDPLVGIRKLIADLRDTWIQVVRKSGGERQNPPNQGVNIAG
ncbi:MAG: flagellar export chaperone FliS [Spirochaetales bacterium]|nr:flagellar export chaperone FliS [Spirochaetales bacterium]